jgi:hypothetical protein
MVILSACMTCMEPPLSRQPPAPFNSLSAPVSIILAPLCRLYYSQPVRPESRLCRTLLQSTSTAPVAVCSLQLAPLPSSKTPVPHSNIFTFSSFPGCLVLNETASIMNPTTLTPLGHHGRSNLAVGYVGGWGVGVSWGWGSPLPLGGLGGPRASPRSPNWQQNFFKFSTNPNTDGWGRG